jgi:flagellar motor switch protein FliN/FliY
MRPAPRPAPAQPKAPVTVQPVQFTSLGAASARQDRSPLSDLGILLDVPLRITVELGRAEMSVREILALGPGSVIELDRSAGEVLDVLVNGTLVAQGEVVVVDEQFGIRLTRVFSPSSGIFEGMGGD